jgi:tetratricopeptide (TPR) repeat protein
MKYNRLIVCGMLLALVASTGIWRLAGADDTPKLPEAAPSRAAVLDGFVASCEKNTGLEPALRQTALATVGALRADEDRAAEAIPEALGHLYPAFRQALVNLSEEHSSEAIRVLRKLAESQDPHLAGHAAFYLGRALAADERFEEALPWLEQVAVGRHLPHTLHSGEAMFLFGTCQANVLKREAAIQTLVRFLDLYPRASERMRMGAVHMIAQQQSLIDGSIVDVHDRMGWSRRRLTIEESGKPTQEGQAQIVALLDKLIEEAEQRENSGGGGGGGGGQGQGAGSGPPSGNQTPSSPATQSALPEGAGRIGALHQMNRGRAADSWGNLPDRERAKVLSALKARFPDRYRQLIEQYYKSFQEEPRETPRP